MERLPKRTSLVAETVRTLKEWITTRLLSGMLPGEMRLKARLGVGRDTLRLALKILEQDGWISPARKARQRRILASPAATRRREPQRHDPVTFLSPYPIVDRIVLLEMEELQKRLGEQGRMLRFLAAPPHHLNNPGRYLFRLIGENPSAAWILYSVGEATQHWFERRGLPSFVYGTPFPDIRIPYVVNDWDSAAFHAGVQLIRHGHKTIGVLGYQDRSPGVMMVIRSLRRALATVSEQPSLVVFNDDRTPDSVVTSLEAAFNLKERPTALVLNGSSQLLTSYSWMLSRGIGVPRDVSLICIPSDNWFQDLYPQVCHYENNPRVFAHYVAQRMMELVETGRITHRSVHVRLEYVAGGTVGPAPEI